jgi:hypothetical protein
MRTVAAFLFRHRVQSLLGLWAVLATANWAVQPERASTWLAAAGLLAGLALVARLVVHRRPSSGPRRNAVDGIRTGILFAASIMAVTLAATLAYALGAIADPTLSQRIPMVVIGAYFVFAGNAMPKRLTPLAALRCDPATAQAVQRLAGWAWVLSGLAVAGAWLALPPDLAEPISVAAILGGGFVVLAKIASVRWLRPAGA